MTVIESEALGIFVRYNFRKSNQKEGVDFYSVFDQQKINLIEEIGDDQFVPIGAFVNPKIAWLAVKDFLTIL